MNSLSFLGWMEKFRCSFSWSALLLLVPCLAVAQTKPVAITVEAKGSGPAVPPRFLGLSYEMSMLLPVNGRYYFDPGDKALVNTF